MTARPDYLRYLESATQAEFAERLRGDGYSVESDSTYGDVQFDLVARKGAQSIAYEFKAGRSPKSSREKMERLQQAAKLAGFEFHIVVVRPPSRVNVEVDDLGSQLLDYVINESFPDELNSLSTHTIISGVSDLEISDIHVGKGEIRVAGTGALEVELRYGSDSDGVSNEDAFPFEFKAILSADGRLQMVEELIVDTSSFYQ